MTTNATPEQEYFHRIEDTFIRLRGAPFLLSPTDWRIAQGWHERLIPVEVVCQALETVFERRVERGVEGKVQSLRYCAAAVESAWQERVELGVAAAPAEDRELDVKARLDRLARALPKNLAERSDWQERIRGTLGVARETEERLAVVDRALTDACLAGLDESARNELEAAVEASLEVLRDRLAPEVLAADRRRLLSERVRRQAELPLVSLFSPEATSR